VRHGHREGQVDACTDDGPEEDTGTYRCAAAHAGAFADDCTCDRTCDDDHSDAIADSNRDTDCHTIRVARSRALDDRAIRHAGRGRVEWWRAWDADRDRDRFRDPRERWRIAALATAPHSLISI